MATRSITGTVKKSNGSAWGGATVRFELLDDTFRLTPDESYPITLIEATTNASGVFSVTLVSGLDVAYRVTMPDRETFNIAVPDGSATTLELLRAAYAGVPAALDNVETALLGLIDDVAVQNLIDHDNLIDNGGAGSHAAATAHIAATAAHGATGAVVGTTNTQTLTNKTLTTPTIADLTNAQHDHLDADDGGTLSAAAITSGTVAPARLGSGSGGSTKFLREDSTWQTASGGGGSVAVKEGNVDVVAVATSVDFNATDFNVTDGTAGRAVIALATPGGGGGTGSTVYPTVIPFMEGSADNPAILAVGTKGSFRMPYAATITGYSILTDVSATVVLDLWRGTGTTRPTNTNSITGSAKPTLTADDVVTSTTLTGWSTALAAGDLLVWEVESNNNAHEIVFLVGIERTIVNQYTNEDAQDAVGTILVDSTSIDLTYSDATPSITAAAIFGTGAGTVAEGNHAHAGVYEPAGVTSGDISDFAEAAQDAVGAIIADTATIDATYTDATPEITLAVIDDSSVQKTDVRKNSAGTVHSRRRLNLIEGANVTLTVADDATDNEIDITIAAAGGGGGGSLAVQEGGTPVVGTATALNFDASDFNISDETAGVAGVALAYGTGAGTPAEGNHNHSGVYSAVGHSHVAADTTDFNEAAQDAVGAMVANSTGITLAYNDATPALTATPVFAGSGGSFGTAGTLARSDHSHAMGDLSGVNEAVDDRVNDLIIDGIALTKTYNDTANTLTLDVDVGTTAGTVAAGDHTHTSAGVTDFTEAVQDVMGAILTDTSSIDWAYNDGANTLTAAVITAGTGSAATPAKSDHTHTVTKSLNFPFGDEDGLGAVVATTARKMITIPTGWGTCTITRWRVLLDQSATVTLDIWKDSYANYPPVNADSITASAKPNTSAATKNESTTLTGWTTTFTGGDVLIAEVEANNLAKAILLSLEFQMTAA